MGNEARRYPIDMESLHLGTVISAEQIAEISGHHNGTTKHSLTTLAIIGEIERYFEDRALPMLPVQQRGSIVIIGGDDMVDALAYRQRRAIRSIGRGVVQSQRVDLSELSEHARKALNGVQYVGSRLTEGARLMRRELNSMDKGKSPKRFPPPWAKGEDNGQDERPTPG